MYACVYVLCVDTYVCSTLMMVFFAQIALVVSTATERCPTAVVTHTELSHSSQLFPFIDQC